MQQISRELLFFILKRCSVFGFFLSPFLVQAQNVTGSPYSIFGPGEQQFGGNASASGMGQVSQGLRNPYEVNWLNPASYSAFLQTNIQAAATLSLGKISDSSQSNSVSNAYLAYINFGIPVSIKKGWGFSFGVSPYTGTGYNVNSTVTFHDTVNATENFLGRGGLSKAYAGIGVRLYKDSLGRRTLSAGANIIYVLGQIINSTQFVIPSQYYLFNHVEERRTYIGGVMFDYGVQYHHENKAGYFVNIGTSFNLQSEIGASRLYDLRTTPIGYPTGVRDTIYNTDNESGSIVLPASFKGGFSIGLTDKWNFSADAFYTQWEQFRNFHVSDSLRNTYGVHAGGSFTPDASDYKNIFRRMEYRAGFFYEQGNVVFNGTGIDLMGVSVGFGLPLAKSRSRINASIEYFKRGTSEHGLVAENYFRFTLGVNFSDKWFYRHRYD